MSSRPPYQLYSETLSGFCHQNQLNLHFLKRQILRKDSSGLSYNYGAEHWIQCPDPTSHGDHVTSGEVSDSRWENHDVIFTGLVKQAQHQDQSEKDFQNNYCYLCSTVEEHQRHLIKKGVRLKKKKKVKPRTEFIVPLPVNKVKKKEEDKDKEEILYKINVKTAAKPNAGTDANVFITLHSGKYSTQKHQLRKKMAWVQFHFGKGTNEVFFIKGPKIGDLKYITIEHDGVEKRQGWLLKEIRVTNMAEKKTWLFQCDQWLSLYEGDLSIKKNLRAVEIEQHLAEYEVKVYTGNHKWAETDSNVYITLYGKKGVSRKMKLWMQSRMKECFMPGKEDVFILQTENIGHISRIRIERDQSGRNAGWFLEKVNIQDASGRSSLFLCHDWLNDHKNSSAYKDLWAASHRSVKEVMRKTEKKETSDQLKYEVSTLTGDMRYAGTDANIYLKLIGKKGTSREMRLNSNAASFERGKMDTFQLFAEDVGSVQKVKIRHDNTGLGAGWFLEKLIVKMYFPKDEIKTRLMKIDKDLTKGEEKAITYNGPRKTREEKGVFDSHHRYEDDNSSSDSDSSVSSDEESYRYHQTYSLKDLKPKQRKSMKKISSREQLFQRYSDRHDEEFESDKDLKKEEILHHKYGCDEEYIAKKDMVMKHEEMMSESNDDLSDNGIDRAENSSIKDGIKAKVPFYEEYIFPCGHWLATDEEDGLIARELKLNSVTTIYKINKKGKPH